MTRIVGGLARGRRLQVAPGTGTRPTSDRAREGLFSTLESLGGLGGARVLDLYAGSGAVGLEALSRGAAAVLLVESDPRALRAVRDNVAAVGLPGAEVASAPVERLVAAAPAALGYDVCFLDPPYALPDEQLRSVLRRLRAGGWLAPGALVAVERASRGDPWVWPEGYDGEHSRRYGEAMLWYGRAAGAAR